MSQLDWVSGSAPRAAFNDCRDTRAAIAQKKAELMLTLGALINKAPPAIAAGGSAQQVIAWKNARAVAAAVAAKKRASVNDIEMQIKQMRAYW